jgi:hypothetical protein
MCIHCGFATCEEKFYHALTLDYTDLEYGAVHHLLVATYMLQHNRYTLQAAFDIVQVMQTLLETAPSQHHKQLVRQFSSGATRVESSAASLRHRFGQRGSTPSVMWI